VTQGRGPSATWRGSREEEEEVYRRKESDDALLSPVQSSGARGDEKPMSRRGRAKGRRGREGLSSNAAQANGRRLGAL
jgi:hypothetical protein